MLIYMTQIDKQNKVPTEQPTLSPESDETTTEQPTLSSERNIPTSNQSTTESGSELLVLEQNGSEKQSESQVNSEKKNRENDRKMEIKRRSINNTWVHFSFTFLIICSIFLSFFSICALKNEFISLRGIMVIISVLLINAAAVTATYCEIDNNSQ